MARQNRKVVRDGGKAQHKGNAQGEAKKKATRTTEQKLAGYPPESTYLDEYLTQRTGWSSGFWFNWIGERISYHATHIEGQVHDECDSVAWLEDLVEYVHETIQDNPIYDWTKMDGNIIEASLVGLILSFWSCRIIRAKCYDGRRPAEIRRNMMKNLNRLHHCILDSIINESKDHTLCPSQGWDPPFSPDAQDGDYV